MARKQIAAVVIVIAGLAQAGCDRPVAAAPSVAPALPPVVSISCAPIEKALQCRATASTGEGAEKPESTAVVQILVDDEHGIPQVAHDVEGVVRDLTNMGIADVEVTLADAHGRTQTAKTDGTGGVSDGAFRFSPVLSGTYQVTARRRDYR